ncbi:MAG: hypothetical protein HOF75_08210 [Flavobacteriaceae bacterium]|jgi:hypothetical protein|nr:hypothetical protein [Flavobacteriaceae bacterium]MBT3872592.1 hypothetical protein [Flavobacteriaceae bacterium]MBT3919540.1 hypothetical protein [Flavobacteriaceae bacterium]MBT6706231.1 hypothetical protein [Flavobacteriaceae bacterium]MBT7243266.1 hypothetical protein [Flavobacteriaceae bacterium]|tara:strand:+ start:1173 stop:2609 length:1437 start_codon:yes stop_codon:yes gene_type:complete
MKTIKNYKLAAFFFAMTLAVSCVKDDDYDMPNTDSAAPIINGTMITINVLNSLLEQEQNVNGNDILSFIESNLYISGFVISNDEAGNIYEELVLQDLAINPSRGVKVLINVSPLFTTFEFGRKVFVKLDGQSVGYNGGVLSLGFRDGNQVEAIAESLMDQTIIRAIELAEIEPLSINISDFSAAKTNLYLRLNDVQFNRNDALGENRKTFAAEPEDEFDGERNLESCAEGFSVILSTSTFSDFKAIELPQGRGYLDGILTYNYFGDTFNMVLNSPETIHFNSTDRCDLVEVDCGLAETTGSNVIFSEFFESQEVDESITGNGWTNYIQEGSRDYEAYFSDGGNGNPSLGISASIGSYNSNDDSTIAWLIMPEIDFDVQDGETINFKTSNSFSDGSTLVLLFSSDWDGNPDTIATSTWDSIPAAYIVQDDDFYGDWYPSGNISLDCINGKGYIGFKYTGNGKEDFDGTYELDEIIVNSN